MGRLKSIKMVEIVMVVLILSGFCTGQSLRAKWGEVPREQLEMKTFPGQRIMMIEYLK
ncbi:MAG: hypothetical protein HYV28_01775 [Ignavibacteriales bacterium]|nr:hypothetical protein [Ignavibacteriales bacterium]